MNWLENMTLQAKLKILTGIMIAAMITLGVMGFKATAGWELDMTNSGKISTPKLVGLGRVRDATKQIAVQLYRVRGLKGSSEMNANMVDSSEAMNKAFERIANGLKVYEAVEHTPEEEIEWKKYQEDYPTWLKLNKKFRSDFPDVLAKSTDPVEIEALYATMTERIMVLKKYRLSTAEALQNVYNIVRNDIQVSSAESIENSSSYKQMFMIVSVLSILFAIILAWALIKSITRAITQSVTTIRDGTMQITSASDQVASSSSSLAQGSSEQASSVEEVSATLEESTAINTQNTDNARQADILAKNANDSAKAGYEKGEQLSHSMHAITESAAKISGIIKTIDQIAFQTNLLALNAAVEAARAGEHGLGFAVVADEVRNLAQRAASAAKETSDIIEEVVGQIKQGNEIALATHTSFEEIVEQSKKVSDLIGEISTAGKEQSEGMTQINQAMGQVDQVTQQVAANSEEAAAAAEELNAQATSMMETVQILAKMVGMDSDTPASAHKKRPMQHVQTRTTPLLQQKVQISKSNSSTNKAEEIFPLHEDDLKEF